MQVLHFLKLFLLLSLSIGLCVYGASLLFVISHFDGTAELPADCAIVFGAAVRPVRDREGDIVGATAGPGIARRVATATALYRDRQVKRLFLAGGKGTGRQRSEAEVMRELAISHGVASGAIVLEEQSTSTRENIRNTKNLTSMCSSIIGISDRYHLARIELLAWREGMRLPTLPANQESSPWFEVRSVLREGVGVLYYLLL